MIEVEHALPVPASVSEALAERSHIPKRDIFDIERSNFISDGNEKSPAISSRASQ